MKFTFKSGSSWLLCGVLMIGLFLISGSVAEGSRREKPGPAQVFGRIQYVTSFPDVKVRVVKSFADLRVKIVDSFARSPGEWQIVENLPDFKVEIVDAFEDFTIEYVDAFPGVKK